MTLFHPSSKAEKDSCLKENKRDGYISTEQVILNKEEIQNIKQRYIAFDVETTEFHYCKDRIVEVGAVLFENGTITKRYGSLVNANIPIPAGASAVNHITNDMIRSAPNEDVVYAELVEFFGDALDHSTVICAHNTGFDMGFLSETLKRHGYQGSIRYADTLTLSRKVVYGVHNYKQETLAQHFGFRNENAHRAVSDAEVCGKIFWELLSCL